MDSFVYLIYCFLHGASVVSSCCYCLQFCSVAVRFLYRVASLRVTRFSLKSSGLPPVASVTFCFLDGPCFTITVPADTLYVVLAEFCSSWDYSNCKPSTASASYSGRTINPKNTHCRSIEYTPYTQRLYHPLVGILLAPRH